MRWSRYRTSRSSTKFFLDTAEILPLSSRSRFWAVVKMISPASSVVHHYRDVPRARSSSSSVSCSAAILYMADTLYRLAFLPVILRLIVPTGEVMPLPLPLV